MVWPWLWRIPHVLGKNCIFLVQSRSRSRVYRSCHKRDLDKLLGRFCHFYVMAPCRHQIFLLFSGFQGFHHFCDSKEKMVSCEQETSQHWNMCKSRFWRKQHNIHVIWCSIVAVTWRPVVGKRCQGTAQRPWSNQKRQLHAGTQVSFRIKRLILSTVESIEWWLQIVVRFRWMFENIQEKLHAQQPNFSKEDMQTSKMSWSHWPFLATLFGFMSNISFWFVFFFFFFFFFAFTRGCLGVLHFLFICSLNYLFINLSFLAKEEVQKYHPCQVRIDDGLFPLPQYYSQVCALGMGHFVLTFLFLSSSKPNHQFLLNVNHDGGKNLEPKMHDKRCLVEPPLQIHFSANRTEETWGKHPKFHPRDGLI